MNKFLLVLFLIIKLLVIIVFPIILIIFKKDVFKKYIFWIEVILLIGIIILTLIGFPYMVDSNISNILNFKLLSKYKESNINGFIKEIDEANIIEKVEPSEEFKTHKNDKVYYYNGFEKPLSIIKVECDEGYDYLRYYSDIITSTASMLSSYFNKTIDPIEVYNKAQTRGLVKCGEPINQDDFFYMIYDEYKVNFEVISSSDLENYILNGKIVLLETKGNGVLSCTRSYFLIYDINNLGNYLLLDPNNKSYSYICPEGTNGFGNVLKPNYNELTFDYSTILSDTRRLIVIGGTR